MAVQHTFQDYNHWNNGFYTQDSILCSREYAPEVIIIGTFNHGGDWNWNDADFFYGRGMYMWTIMGNLFLYGNNHLMDRRTLVNDNPTMLQIFQICLKAKLCFADIVKGTKPHIATLVQDRSILVNNQYVWNDYKDGHLDHMGRMNWLNENVDAIVNYIQNTPSIKLIYFTFKSGNWLVEKMNEIIHACPNVRASSIFTPTGNGFGNNLTAPFHERAWSIGHSWIWNDLQHLIPVTKPGYGHLDHEWLANKGVFTCNF